MEQPEKETTCARSETWNFNVTNNRIICFKFVQYVTRFAKTQHNGAYKNLKYEAL